MAIILFISINTDLERTKYAALHIVNYLNYEMDRNRTPTNVYLDLSKAFDTLSYNIPLPKLGNWQLGYRE